MVPVPRTGQHEESRAPMTLPAQHTADPVVEQAVARLVSEFGTRLRPQVVGSVVRSSRRDLSGVPVTALPEMVERLARARLQSVG
ncbi:hypothetical protein SAMN05660359_01175 [Geodermatophilus obscurus]|uniref:Uncharacterized protein n=2 Tax=Geodermatophilus obscurus TaxID=1861 RepID=A0A1I5DZ89_9ACTN|nr:hypothetical protein SAMN05660359_01175 [Geodermatophilus obscurus]